MTTGRRSGGAGGSGGRRSPEAGERPLRTGEANTCTEFQHTPKEEAQARSSREEEPQLKPPPLPNLQAGPSHLAIAAPLNVVIPAGYRSCNPRQPL